jgi:hypothetical protein
MPKKTSPKTSTKRSRARAPVKKSKTNRPLTPWNMAMKEATKQLRVRNPGLRGPDLFKQGAVLAHKLIASGKFGGGSCSKSGRSDGGEEV